MVNRIIDSLIDSHIISNDVELDKTTEDLINRLYELKDLELLDAEDIEKIIEGIKKAGD